MYYCSTSFYYLKALETANVLNIFVYEAYVSTPIPKYKIKKKGLGWGRGGGETFLNAEGKTT